MDARFSGREAGNKQGRAGIASF